ncbi:MAG: hypothetical protein GY727_01980 [Gammaproteobacteria bacterium]|nr:hypothetical protein [Gammaproteobacteria bacterium]
MVIEIIAGILGWAAVLNYAVLIVWFLVFTLAHDWIYGMHHKWFKIPPESFDVIHYAALAFYKLCIFLFLLGPYIALRIINW